MRAELSVEAFESRRGEEVGVSAWATIDQDRIDRFAAVTGDDQWIHVDPERARRSAFGGTVAHGFLTLSLVATLMRDTVAVADATAAVNYGANRVRFVTPVPAGGRVRARFSVGEVARVPGGVQVTWNVTVELEGSARPALVAEWIVRYLGGSGVQGAERRFRMEGAS